MTEDNGVQQTDAAAVPASPLEALGLGPNWRPTPSTWKWAKVAIGDTQLQVLRIYNGGGVFGAALTHEQLVAFCEETIERVRHANDPKLAVPEQGLIVPGPNRAERRHPR